MKVLFILLIFMAGLFAKVNINTASIKKLESIKGIGTKKAAAIIKYRKTHKFKNIKDIMKVKGIRKKMFEKIKEEISVEDKEK